MTRSTRINTIYFLFVILALSLLGCGSSVQDPNPNIGVSTPIDKQDAERLLSSRRSANAAEFLGCWASGSGKDIRITENQIFSSTNSYKPVDYVAEKRSDSLPVLRLIDRPQFYFFQEYISLELEPDSEFPLTIKNYLSREDLDQRKSGGISGWVKFNCADYFGTKPGKMTRRDLINGEETKSSKGS